MIKTTFGSHKPIIAMIHFGPLPGSPLYDKDGGMQKLIDLAAADITALQNGGVDAVMFGNEGDRPYLLKASPQSLAAMSFAVGELKRMIKIPFGVNYLWDPVASVALGVASGARFVREIFTGVYDSDMGLWAPDAASAVRLRADCNRSDLKLMYNINAEFASPIGDRSIAARAKSAVFSSLADVVLVSGPMTGEAVETGNLTVVKNVLPDTPVFANTGVNINNVADILGIADGAVIGTHFKVDGDTWKAVDQARVSRFMDKVGKIR
ncbi:BtpA/SgcQ family protein [Dongia rigui]|uniref:BtpA/SgcQ family protein n=1 Tax=Dongia rigui TaxID=940149 RepID=A0ABU5E2L9_9PROT|nr:BtpA/SgcQ family protein [Dongia rigui]MDY0873806.1 BtpA/SgcQ family protein [Dongia rigui]